MLHKSMPDNLLTLFHSSGFNCHFSFSQSWGSWRQCWWKAGWLLFALRASPVECHPMVGLLIYIVFYESLFSVKVDLLHVNYSQVGFPLLAHNPTLFSIRQETKKGGWKSASRGEAQRKGCRWGEEERQTKSLCSKSRKDPLYRLVTFIYLF